jgi:Tol biopolymer transport system component/plastocyanin
MWGRAIVVAAVAATVAACGGGKAAEKQADAPSGPGGKPIVTRSADSEAPPNAPAHWLSPEAWVYNHWLPYDETRLYRLLGITRVGLWEQLRDDRRTLAQLAARHGWPDPRKLAAALVAPEAARVGAERADVLRARALRTITQGHLAQHLFFHSLHQFGIASEAPDIFGVSDIEFRRLRRAELSPLAIARLHGRSPGEVEALAIAVLRERARTGVRGGAMTRAQADRLLRRQLSQLPRWLDQARYNGPPPTYRGALVQVPRDYASNPSISADGRHVAYEAYRQKLPLAITFGEIAVMRTDLATRKTAIVSRLPRGGPTGPDPISAYNASISADGERVVFESSRGNQNFAKRYGRIGVLLAHGGRTDGVDRRSRDVPDSQSAYNPALAADGSHVAYEAVRDGRTVVLVRGSGGRTRTVVRGARVGGATFADPYEPGLSADGSKVVYTLASGRVDDPAGAGSQVLVRDVATGRTTVASRTNGGARADGFSADPAISPDGRFVVFTSDAANLGAGSGPAGLFVRDLRTGHTRRIPTGAARVLDPVASRAARVVAFTAIDGPASRVLAWSRTTGDVTLVSRAKTAGNGVSEDPSISADGRRIAFASTATNLDPRKADDTRAIFVRDRAARATRVVSDPLAAYPKGAVKPPPVKPAPAPLPGAEPVAAGGRDDVLVVDNAFVRRGERPTVTIGAGTRLTWEWRSRESHAITVRSGPERFAVGARNSADYSHAFDRPGTYQIVCALHAPGMRMTVVVDGKDGAGGSG